MKSWSLCQEHLEKSSIGYACFKALFNSTGAIVDFELLDANKQFEQLAGIKIKPALNQKVLEKLSLNNNFNWFSHLSEIALDNGK